ARRAGRALTYSLQPTAYSSPNRSAVEGRMLFAAVSPHDVFGRDGSGEIESLSDLATVLEQEGHLLGRLDAFGDRRDIQCAAHRDDRFAECGRCALAWRRQERLVDLERMDREQPQIAQ